MLVYAVSSKAAAQRDLGEPVEKRHHIFLEGERVLLTAAYVALSSVQEYFVLIICFLVFTLKDLTSL